MQTFRMRLARTFWAPQKHAPQTRVADGVHYTGIMHIIARRGCVDGVRSVYLGKLCGIRRRRRVQYTLPPAGG